MIKNGRGSLKVGVVAKNCARFARNYTYNPTILKFLDPPLYCTCIYSNFVTPQKCLALEMLLFCFSQLTPINAALKNSLHGKGWQLYAYAPVHYTLYMYTNRLNIEHYHVMSHVQIGVQLPFWYTAPSLDTRPINCSESWCTSVECLVHARVYC